MDRRTDIPSYRVGLSLLTRTVEWKWEIVIKKSKQAGKQTSKHTNEITRERESEKERTNAPIMAGNENGELYWGLVISHDIDFLAPLFFYFPRFSPAGNEMDLATRPNPTLPIYTNTNIICQATWPYPNQLKSQFLNLPTLTSLRPSYLIQRHSVAYPATPPYRTHLYLLQAYNKPYPTLPNCTDRTLP